ncbi:MAG: hypothetical protein WAM82_12665 [Thermoanaerobaculia bacterium]
MLTSRLHLVLSLSALLLLSVPYPGAPMPAMRVLLEKTLDFQPLVAAAVRPEPIEVEPVGAAFNGEAKGSSW